MKAEYILGVLLFHSRCFVKFCFYDDCCVRLDVLVFNGF